MTAPVISAGTTTWPELPWHDWHDTLATVHMWTQIVGKIRLALTPPLNHWWHVTLFVTARGLTTSPIPYAGGVFEIDFDFVEHRLRVVTSDGRSFATALEPKSVAFFYGELMDTLRRLDIDVRIWPRPVEVEEAIPFEEDEIHASYERAHATAWWRALAEADRVMKMFQGGYVGKVSPVHFFWGGFDLAASRYSGRAAPLHRGGIPNCPDWVMQEATSREEAAFGWWPLDREFGPAFYAYAYPEPGGYRAAAIEPAHAVFDERLGEYVLPWDAVRRAPNPEREVLAFLESTYRAGADLGGWDRSGLEPATLPGTPPTGSWSTSAR
jgi:hypothetical protein